MNQQSGTHQITAYRTQSSSARKAKRTNGLRAIASAKAMPGILPQE